jgi:hypothetical protein
MQAVLLLAKTAAETAAKLVCTQLLKMFSATRFLARYAAIMLVAWKASNPSPIPNTPPAAHYRPHESKENSPATHLLLLHQQLWIYWLLGPLFLPKPTTAHHRTSARV